MAARYLRAARRDGISRLIEEAAIGGNMKFGHHKWRPLSFLLAVVIAAPAVAQQQPYAVTNSGWHIYKEQLSCSMYLDTENGTMLRFSNRVDEERMYVLAVNDKWTDLRPRIYETLSATLMFDKIKRGHTSASMVVENGDGRLGYTMADINRQNFLFHLAAEGQLILSVMRNNSRKLEEIERIDISGAYEAALKLVDCSVENF